jgi:hypothetical protein
MVFFKISKKVFVKMRYIIYDIPNFY